MEDLLDKTIEELEQEGYRIIDVIAGDVPTSKEMQYIIEKISQEKSETFHSDILYNLTSERFTEIEAKKLWQEILHHKYVTSEVLKRNIGVRVAALDYLENITKLITAPKFIDITEFRKTLKLAETDPLTGALNRRMLIKYLEEEIKLVSGSRYSFCILMLDLDGFKEYNDKEGHQAGDLILQEFAAVLRGELRKDDIIGRYGGDEFLILLKNMDKRHGVEKSETIRKVIENEFKSINITVSIGLAEYHSDGSNSEDLISLADEALYRAKEFGKNKVICFKDIEINYQARNENIAKISCIGDFNRWNKTQGAMKYVQDVNQWKLQLKLKPGVYRYKFLLNDTKWMADPKAVEFVDDGFGGKCSVLKIPVEEACQ